jgi:hypothetical protein
MDFHPATTHFGEKEMKAPRPFIQLLKEVSDAGPLVAYIASKTNSTALEAEDKLFSFSKLIRDQVNNGEVVTWEGVGKFLKDGSGQLAFEEMELPEKYWPAVGAERVIHPHAEHPMVVGNSETTNTAMEAFFSAEEPAKKERWWIWAIILTLVALTATGYHYYAAGSFEKTGNQNKPDIQQSP